MDAERRPREGAERKEEQATREVLESAGRAGIANTWEESLLEGAMRNLGSA